MKNQKLEKNSNKKKDIDGIPSLKGRKVDPSTKSLDTNYNTKYKVFLFQIIGTIVKFVVYICIFLQLD